MKVILLGLLMGVPSYSLAMDPDAVPSNIPTEQYKILKEFFEKKTASIGRFASELATPWRTCNIYPWLNAQLQTRQNKYYKQRKTLAIKAFLSAGVSGVAGYFLVSDQLLKPEAKTGAAAITLVSAAYSLNNLYEYCALSFPSQDMIVKELEQFTQCNTDHDWQAALLKEIANKYGKIEQK